MTDAEKELITAALALYQSGVYARGEWIGGKFVSVGSLPIKEDDWFCFGLAANKVREERLKGKTFILPQVFQDGDRFVVRIRPDGIYNFVPVDEHGELK